MSSTLLLPTYFISHGGGPWPWIAEAQAMYAPLRAALTSIPEQLSTPPKAILMVSAHWEAEQEPLLVMAADQPSMLYDYYGFPPHTYQLSYPATGLPVLAQEVQALLTTAGIPAVLDYERDFDHGAFVPAYCMYPEAQIPMLQLSIHSDYDPQKHIKIGQALRPLREQGVLIIGSGLSYHNLRNMGPGGVQPSAQFDRWLHETLGNHEHPEQRLEALRQWEQAPSARIAHPREDHLIPLMVAIGAAQEAVAHRFHHETQAFGGLTVSSYRFDS